MKIIFAVAFLLPLFSCQQQDSKNSLDEKSIVISNAWMRPGIINRNTAAFMTITNNMTVDDTLFSVSSDLAKVTELHETYSRENDLMGMRHVDYLVIPSKSTVELKPGSFHVMLIGLNNNIFTNEEVKIVFYFKNNGQISTIIKVK